MLANANLDSDELGENVQKSINDLNKKFKSIEKLMNSLTDNQFDEALDVTNGS